MIGQAIAIALALFGVFCGAMATYHARQAQQCAHRSRTLLKRAAGSLGQCIETIDRADTSEGVCCCGDSVENHGYHSGHSPVDVGDYAAAGVVTEARNTLNAIYERGLP